jgi:hypothetical protein
MVKKKTTRKSTKRKSPAAKPAKKTAVKRKSTKKEREPEYMVQVHEPANLRKNVLESLREIIIFMQSYEKFRQIQEEKVAIFNELKDDIKQLSTLLDHKLKRHFPKGKLSVATQRREVPRITVPENVDEDVEETMETPRAVSAPVSHPITELDELESQLRDIEGQLRKIN